MIMELVCKIFITLLVYDMTKVVVRSVLTTLFHLGDDPELPKKSFKERLEELKEKRS